MQAPMSSMGTKRPEAIALPAAQAAPPKIEDQHHQKRWVAEFTVGPS